MATPGTFRMEGMYRPSPDRADGILDETGLIQGVRMDHHLNIHIVCNRQTGINGLRRCSPVFVQLQCTGPRIDLFNQCCRLRCIPLAGKSQIHREGFCCLQHSFDMPWSGSAGRGVCACGGTGAAPQHGRHTGIEGIVNLLRADEMNMRIKTARRNNLAFTRNSLCPWPDDDVDT